MRLEHLEAWFASARPGDAATIYAIGPAADVSDPSDRWIKAKLQTGAIVTHKGRHPLTGELLHKARLAPAVAVVPAPAAVAAITMMPGRAARMLAVLGELADAALPCPSWTELAELAELRDRQAARYQCRLLEAAGLISIESDGHERVVTVVASGKRTAGRVKG